MKDMMSAGLVKLGQNSQRTFKAMQANVKSAATSNQYLNKSVGELRRELQEVNKIRFGTVLKSEFNTANKAAKSLQAEIARVQGTRSGRSFGGGLSGMFGGLARQFIPYLTAAAIGSFAFSSVRAANEFEAQRTGYGVLTGNQGIGDALSGQLRGLKENTIMGTSVYKNAQTLLAFGVGAKDVTKDLRMLGDISMGDANRLQHLTLAFSEVQAAGRLTGKEVRQMVNAGFNPLTEIARKTGKSMEELRKEMKAGHITAQMLTQAFESATGEGGRFHNMLEKMAETGAGKMAKLVGLWASFKIALGERLQSGSGSVVDTLSKLVHWAKSFVEIPVSQKLQEQIIKIRSLQIELTSANVPQERQLEILKELEQINPNITKGIDDQAISYSKLAQNIANVTGSLQAKMAAELFDKDPHVKDIVDQWSTYQRDRANFVSAVSADIALTDPSIAADTSLSLNDKALKAQKVLIDRVAKNAGKLNKRGYKMSWFQHPDTKAYYMLNDESNDNRLLIDIGQAMAAKIAADKGVIKLSPEMASINAKRKAMNDVFNQYGSVNSMVDAASVGKDKKRTDVSAETADAGVGKSVVSGGPRTISIHGVKFTDKIEIHANSTDEGMKQAERRLEEMFLRLLNSGAHVE